MYTSEERSQFDQHGYLHVPRVIEPDHLDRIREAFEELWHRYGRVTQHQLLTHPLFIDLIEHPPILNRVAAVFGSQTQLLQYDLLRQEKNDTVPPRAWHRDFSFPGDHPVSINTIVYLDEMTDQRGPTYVVPGTHRGTGMPPAYPDPGHHKSLPGEVAVYAQPGDAVFINGAIWHSGSCNQAEGLRRGIYMYYGYWWLKRYEHALDLPWQAFENASEQRLRLLGVKMPGRDLHMYDPET